MQLQSVCRLSGHNYLFLDNPWKAQKFRSLFLTALLIGHLILYFLMKPFQEWLSLCTYCEPYYKSEIKCSYFWRELWPRFSSSPHNSTITPVNSKQFFSTSLSISRKLHLVHFSKSLVKTVQCCVIAAELADISSQENSSRKDIKRLLIPSPPLRQSHTGPGHY